MVKNEHSSNVMTIKNASEPRMFKNILIIDNAVNSDWCDHLIKKYEDTPIEHYTARVGSIDGTDKEVVHLTKLYVAYANDSWDAEKGNMEKLMLDALTLYKMNLRYSILSCGLPTTDIEVELPTIKKYIPNSDDMIGPHSDTYMRGWDKENKLKVWKGDRFLNILFYLNDVEEGGETEFYFDDCTVRVPPKKGRIVIFPPLWTHIHAGLAPKSGNKYICNGHLRASFTENEYNSSYGEYQ